MTRRTTALVLLAVTIPLGLLWRHLPLPLFIWKYGGSTLWTIALYLTLVVLLPRVAPCLSLQLLLSSPSSSNSAA